jgi:hypothetical protein
VLVRIQRRSLVNVRFEGDSTNGWVCQLPFPNEYQTRFVLQGTKAPTTDEAYGNLLDAMAFEIAELREIVGLAQ